MALSIILVNSFSSPPIPPLPTVLLPSFSWPVCSLPCPPERCQQWWVWPNLYTISSSPWVWTPLMETPWTSGSMSLSRPTYQNRLVGGEKWVWSKRVLWDGGKIVKLHFTLSSSSPFFTLSSVCRPQTSSSWWSMATHP